MNNLVQCATDKAIIRAIGADEQANTNYFQILRRFISSKSAFPEEQLQQPVATLNASGLKEISAAWVKLQDTQKKLRTAYMNLYVASIENTFTPSKK